MDRRSFLKFQISLAAFAPMMGEAFAQSAYPTQNVTLVVPFTPGGSTDILARLLGQKLGEALGKAFVIENRAGAGGAVASTAVSRATPDGHTLIMGHIGTLGVNPSLYPNLGYDPVKGFAHLTMLASVHNVLVVHPTLPVKNVAELVAYAKANPGKLNYCSGGNGSAAHIAMAAFMVTTGTQMTHVPYRGAGAVLADLMAGQVQVLVSAVSTSLPLVQGGKLRALMMLSDKRSDVLPDVPTASEEGFEGLEMNYWVGFATPKGTPEAIVNKLNQEINAGLMTPESQKRLKDMAFVPVANTPAQAAQLLESEITRWSALIKQQGIQPE